MKEYIIMGDVKKLEEIVQDKEIEIEYTSRTFPIASITTEIKLEELQEILSDYSISLPKTYEVDK